MGVGAVNQEMLQGTAENELIAMRGRIQNFRLKLSIKPESSSHTQTYLHQSVEWGIHDFRVRLLDLVRRVPHGPGSELDALRQKTEPAHLQLCVCVRVWFWGVSLCVCARESLCVKVYACVWVQVYTYAYMCMCACVGAGVGGVPQCMEPD